MLLEKSVPYELEEIDLRNKPDWFLAISPYGRVPVLVADGTPLFESSAICEFLEETHPEPPLYPVDPILRARDRGWFSASSDDLYKPLVGLLSPPDEAESARSTLLARLSRLDHELGERSWLSNDGTRFGMADVSAAPFLVRLAILERAGQFSAPELPRFRAWSDRVRARDSVARSIPATLEESMRQRLAAARAGKA
jgi:glutathione S-transferase